jgi:hypothetical protein
MNAVFIITSLDAGLADASTGRVLPHPTLVGSVGHEPQAHVLGDLGVLKAHVHDGVCRLGQALAVALEARLVAMADEVPSQLGPGPVQCLVVRRVRVGLVGLLDIEVGVLDTLGLGGLLAVLSSCWVGDKHKKTNENKRQQTVHGLLLGPLGA